MPITPDEMPAADDGPDVLKDESAGTSLCNIVRENPLGAVIGAFVVGFLVSRLI